MLLARLEFDANDPGGHINLWDYDHIREMGIRIGFRRVIESKPGGSISATMQGPEFDLREPQMSLYVDLMR
jgi:hypothetical protein